MACPVSRHTSVFGAMLPWPSRRRPVPQAARGPGSGSEASLPSDGPPVRAGRGLGEQVLGSGPGWLFGHGAVRPDRKRRTSTDQGFRQRGTGQSPCREVIEEKLAKGYREHGVQSGLVRHFVGPERNHLEALV